VSGGITCCNLICRRIEIERATRERWAGEKLRCVVMVLFVEFNVS